MNYPVLVLDFHNDRTIEVIQQSKKELNFNRTRSIREFQCLHGEH